MLRVSLSFQILIPIKRVKLVKMHHLIELKLHYATWFFNYFTFVCQCSTNKITKAFIANANLVSLLITWHHKKWFSFLVGNKGWFHFSIKASFTVDTKGWYCVTKGIISFSSLLFCFRSVDVGFRELHLFLIAIFLSNCVGSLCPSSTIKRSFEFWNTFLKLFWQIGGWQAAKCVLEGFRSLYIKDNFFVESRAFVYNCL